MPDLIGEDEEETGSSPVKGGAIRPPPPVEKSQV